MNDEWHSIERLCDFLAERAAWLDYEIKHGGDANELGVRERECRALIHSIRNGRYLEDGRPSWLVNAIPVPASTDS